jgi:hypothetical protein
MACTIARANVGTLLDRIAALEVENAALREKVAQYEADRDAFKAHFDADDALRKEGE